MKGAWLPLTFCRQSIDDLELRDQPRDVLGRTFCDLLPVFSNDLPLFLENLVSEDLGLNPDFVC